MSRVRRSCVVMMAAIPAVRRVAARSCARLAPAAVNGGSSAGCDCGVDTVDPSNADFQGKIAAGKHRPAMIMLLSAACAGNGVALLPAPLRRSVVRCEGIRWNCLAFRWHARSMDATGVATRRNLTIFSRIEKPSRRELMVKRL